MIKMRIWQMLMTVSVDGSHLDASNVTVNGDVYDMVNVVDALHYEASTSDYVSDNQRDHERYLQQIFENHLMDELEELEDMEEGEEQDELQDEYNAMLEDLEDHKHLLSMEVQAVEIYNFTNSYWLDFSAYN